MPCGDEGFLYDSRRQGPGLVPLVFDFTTYADVWYGCCILSYQYQTLGTSYRAYQKFYSRRIVSPSGGS